MGKNISALTGVEDVSNEWQAYQIDRFQRSILFWDILRKRGNAYLSHLRKGQPALLLFDYELIIDGQTFENPVNFSLLKISAHDQLLDDQGNTSKEQSKDANSFERLTKGGKTIGEDGLPARPIVVIDPRAGHGPGIGGSKLSSQIGIALQYGHPVYFISFTTDPVPGQTIAHVHDAEIAFLEEVAKRHPNAPKAAVIGNCQAGWAAALIGADRPDITGPMVFNGSPLSYWGGAEGNNPMRYKAGLCGGIWLTSLWSDLGNDMFDGANVIAGFEDLNPANTLWSKYYYLFANIDSEEQRFLDFDKWWGGFFKLNSEEIHFIISSLFIGNELENGQLQLERGRRIDLKNSKSPIIAFASEGDNITPPPQALNWIHKVYGSVDEIKRYGQVIIYMVHHKVGHLGIFVSGSVAQKEHNQILGSMGWLDYIGPGLYEMIIEETVDGGGEATYDVRFEERQMEDILRFDDGVDDEIPFHAVNTVSRINDALYRSYASPLIRGFVSEPFAEFLRQMHPLRVQRYTISDENPFLQPIKWMAETIRPERNTEPGSNFFGELENLFAESVKAGFDYFRDVRDYTQEQLFKSLYDTPVIQTIYGHIEQSLYEQRSDEIETKKVVVHSDSITLEESENDGFAEACVRVMVAVTGADGIIDLRELQMAEHIIHEQSRLRMIPPETYRKMVQKQVRILNKMPLKALTSLKNMLASDQERQIVYDIAEKIVRADDRVTTEEETILRILNRVLFEQEVEHG